MAFMLTAWFRRIDAVPMGKLVLRILASPSAFLCAPAALIIIFGMAIHCLSNSNLSLGTKILWSIFAFLTAPFGATIYFFTVYKKQVAAHREALNG
jgi:multisubunit Na+/H+ antiporter MnhG subunit